MRPVTECCNQLTSGFEHVALAERLERWGWVPFIFNPAFLSHRVSLHGTKHRIVNASVINRPVFTDSKGFVRTCVSWKCFTRINDDDKPTTRSHKRWVHILKELSHFVSLLGLSHVVSFSEHLNLQNPGSIQVHIRGCIIRPDGCFSREPYIYEPILQRCDA